MSEWILLRLHRHDERALHALLMRRRPRLDRAMRWITHLGDAAVTIGLTLWMLLSPYPAVAAAGRRAAFALAVSHLLVQVVKRTVTRARPCLPMGVSALVRAPDRFSFPSGHAASSLSVALALAALPGGAWAAGMMALAVAIGLSRCYLGVHYPGDVAAGWTLAAAAAWAAGLAWP
ncbi:MAG TPA: phosphatase PAP2 family protein [Longimicrobium sp.]|nr:phosphatase PAP2 family protein [Longimicrobium sp.]